jgi:hypothetical protein
MTFSCSLTSRRYWGYDTWEKSQITFVTTEKESDSQSCQMVYLHTKNPNLGKFWRALDWKIFIYVLWPFAVFCGHLRYCMTNWFILCSFGTFFPIWVSCSKKNLASLRFYLSRWCEKHGLLLYLCHFQKNVQMAKIHQVWSSLFLAKLEKSVLIFKILSPKNLAKISAFYSLYF